LKEKSKRSIFDIFEEKEREQMLEKDEITAAKGAFMAGREMRVGKRREDLMLEERDAEPVEPPKTVIETTSTFLF
jgi:hypothetical protein